MIMMIDNVNELNVIDILIFLKHADMHHFLREAPLRQS